MDSWSNIEKNKVNVIDKEKVTVSDRKQSGGEAHSGDRKLPLVAIIVPVYNVHAYVGECVESLLQQTYTNLEIILVDDGSTDGSGAVCDEYARKDNRIRVIHQENQGLSGARNTGLDHAEGEYIAFVDSDDAVMPTFIASLYRLLKKYHADIAACAYVRDSGYVNDANVTTLCMSSDQMLRQWHGRNKKYETVAWNKLYRTSVLNGGSDSRMIRFPRGRKHEDVLTSHLIVENANRIALTTQALYRYRTREGSITARTVSGEGMEENLSAQRERMEFFRKKRYFRAYLNLLVGYVLHRVWFGWKKIKSYIQPVEP